MATNGRWTLADASRTDEAPEPTREDETDWLVRVRAHATICAGATGVRALVFVPVQASLVARLLRESL